MIAFSALALDEKKDQYFTAQFIPTNTRTGHDHLGRYAFTPITREEAKKLAAKRGGFAGKIFSFEGKHIQKLQEAS